MTKAVTSQIARRRDSNLELFRIITMMLIVAHHYVVNSGLTSLIYENLSKPNSIFLLLFGAWGKTGINCFVLITGYFMCQSNITCRKFIKLVLEIEFYRILIYFIFCLSGYTAFSLKVFIQTLVPVMWANTNFVGCYLLFYLCIPFLNILLHNLNERQHLYLMVLGGYIYIFLGTMRYCSVTMNYVSWFIVLYVIAAYIRMYPKKIFEDTKLWMGGAFLTITLAGISIVLCSKIYPVDKYWYPYYFVSDSNKILAVMISVSAFLFFKNIKLKYNGIINTIAASTFGVLLIHAHSDLMRQWLWKDTLRNVSMFDSEFLILHAIGSVIAVYSICTLIDYLRIRYIEKPFLKFWDGRKKKLN